MYIGKETMASACVQVACLSKNLLRSRDSILGRGRREVEQAVPLKIGRGGAGYSPVDMYNAKHFHGSEMCAGGVPQQEPAEEPGWYPAVPRTQGAVSG